MRRNSEQVLTEWLVLGAQAGQVAAIEELLKIWYPILLRYAMHQLGSRDAAEDVVQETAITVARTIRKLRDPVTFPKWTYQILHRRGVDYQRKEIRRRNREVTGASTDESDIVDDTVEDEQESGQLIRNALKGLGELSYNVIHLHYLHDLSVKEIATICDIPEGTVKSRLHTARGKLRKLLAETL